MDKNQIAFEIMKATVPSLRNITVAASGEKSSYETTSEKHVKIMVDLFNQAYNSLVIKDDPEK